MGNSKDIISLEDLKAAVDELRYDLLSGGGQRVPGIGELIFYAENIDPHDRFPGTEWERVDGYFLRMSTEGGDGGYDEITLSVNNLPEHNHTMNHTHGNNISIVQNGSHYHNPSGGLQRFVGMNTSGVSRHKVGNGGTAVGYTWTTDSTTSADAMQWCITDSQGVHGHSITGGVSQHEGATGPSGGSRPFDNRPKYLNVYTWKRVA